VIKIRLQTSNRPQEETSFSQGQCTKNQRAETSPKSVIGAEQGSREGKGRERGRRKGAWPAHLAGHDESTGLVADFEYDAAVAGAEFAQFFKVVVHQFVPNFLFFLEKEVHPLALPLVHLQLLEPLLQRLDAHLAPATGQRSTEDSENRRYLL